MPRRSDCRRLIDPADPRVWTAHEHIEVRRLTAGQQILLTGHKFAVGHMTFESAGRLTGDPRPGRDFMADVAAVELQLVHAPWKGCPAVEPSDRHMPQGWRSALAALREAALALLAHPETTPGDAAFLRERLAPLLDLDDAEAANA